MQNEWLLRGGEPEYDGWVLGDIVRDLPDRLQAEVVVHRDRVEVRGLVPVTIPESGSYAT